MNLAKYLISLALTFSLAAPALAAEKAKEDITAKTPQPTTKKTSKKRSSKTFIDADNIKFNHENETIHASGNVKVTQNSNIIFADEIEYDKKTQYITAQGNVFIKQADGSRIIGQKLVLKDDFTKLDGEYTLAKLPDDSLIKARHIAKDGNITKLKSASYTSCLSCSGDKDKTPTWKINAWRITIDKNKEEVFYTSAYISAHGVPVFYTPFFMHPTPGAKRKTGLLTPSYKSDKVLGNSISTPFYLNAAPNYDFTYTPTFMTHDNLRHELEYRHLFTNGEYKFSGGYIDENQALREKLSGQGININNEEEVKWVLRGKGSFEYKNNWSLGFEGEKFSETTYLNRYDQLYKNFSTSNLVAQQYDDNNSTILETLYFQDHLTTSNVRTPYALPYIDIHRQKVSSTKYFASEEFDLNSVILERKQGDDLKRVSATKTWIKPFISKNGSVSDFRVSTRGDVYSFGKEQTAARIDNNENLDVSAARILPQAEYNWRMPFIKESAKRTTLIEPQIQTVFSQKFNSLNENEMLNEDSVDPQLIESNLFDSNKYSGYDRVEEGLRINYGIKTTIFNNPKLTKLEAFLGQSFRPTNVNNFDAGSGMATTLSDYVGSLEYSAEDFYKLAYRFRVDSKTNIGYRDEIDSRLVLDKFTFNLYYFSLDERKLVGSNGALVKNLTTGASWKIMRNIELTSDATVDLRPASIAPNNGIVRSSYGFIYTGDCFNYSINLVEDHIRAAQSLPSETITFTFTLKNIGAIY